MPRVPPVQSTSFSAPIEPQRQQERKEKPPVTPAVPSSGKGELTFTAEILPSLSGQDMIKECGHLHESSLGLAKDVVTVEKAIEKLDGAKKGMAAVESIALTPVAHIDLTQENILDPLTLLHDGGMSIGLTLDEANDNLLNIELVLRAMQGAGEGVVLIFRHQYLHESKRFLELLKIKGRELRPDSKQAVQFNQYLTELDKKIKKEEVTLDEFEKEYAASNAGYLPTGVSTVVSLCDKATTAATTTLGWVGGVASSGLCYYEKHKAEKSADVHGKFVEDIARLSEKHAMLSKREDASSTAFERRKKLKEGLKELTFKRHEKIDEYLQFNMIKKNARFYAVTFLTFAYLALQTAALVVAVAAFVMFPQFALLGAMLAFLAVGIYYWSSNRPNLFKELIMTSMKSLYYTIGSAIDSWKLQSKKVKLIEHTARHVDLIAQQLRQGEKVDPAMIEKFARDHDVLKKSVETLDKDVKYWTSKKQEIQARLLNAELEDINRLQKKKSLSVNAIVEQIKGVYKHLTEDDKKELMDVVGLDLNKLDVDPSTTQIQERMLKSYLGMDEDELIKVLKEKRELHERYSLG